ncbi:clan AA aspartic protease, TIGR02281 family [Methylophaga frappieri]|uniref:Clan AA aspartic protease, TIGR02281 family n=1 Tax=Methylophaga frappieri (strain ATCC BAA-2434 / DSM 25690 / JAM7) TaxID=754477 RepID=I1YKZ0_METFJ|nr:retropepsin-like aspartic protease [Methylophaga frappieri]AFJ03583.1 clan AA aspartic protease, TIGR02281 family [Methylophaga frappieri]
MSISGRQTGATSGLAIVFWLLLMASLTLFFNGFIDRQDNPNRHLNNATPQSQVVLERNRAGHYVAPGKINGHDVTFLLDTGATHISIPAGVARAAGLVAGRAVRVNTANGIITVHQTRLQTVQLGGIVLSEISANINAHMSDEIVLLGMSFMRHLDMTQRDGMLTLKLP